MKFSGKKYLLIRRISLISKIIWELLLYAVTLMAAMALVFVYIAALVAPSDTTWFVPFGLGAPFIFVINLLSALFWTIRWKRMAFVPAALLLLGMPVVARHVQIPIFQHYDKEQRNDIRLMTYNVHTFHNASWRSSIDSVARFIKKNSPDIVALQEYYATSSKTTDSLRRNMSGYPHFKIYYLNKNGGAGFGLAIFSRHKIIETKEIAFKDKSNGAMYADMVIDGDTIRIFNCHLQTTNVDNTDIAFVRGGTRSRTDVSFGSIMDKVKENCVKRAEQADLMARHIKMSPYPVVVCGDFNDVPASYTYKRLSAGLKDCFKRAGRGYAHSFHDFFGLFNLDYVMYDPEQFDCVYYSSPSLAYSDHNPIIVRLRDAGWR